jgi:hypothetical protein
MDYPNKVWPSILSVKTHWSDCKCAMKQTGQHTTHKGLNRSLTKLTIGHTNESLVHQSVCFGVPWLSLHDVVLSLFIGQGDSGDLEGNNGKGTPELETYRWSLRCLWEYLLNNLWNDHGHCSWWCTRTNSWSDCSLKRNIHIWKTHHVSSQVDAEDGDGP